MNVVELFTAVAARQPDAPALFDRSRGGDRVMSFASLDLAARRLATMLERAGIESGDAVLIFHPPTAELYVALLAMFRLGAVAMVVELSAGRGLVDAACRLRPPKALLATPRAHLLRLVSPAMRAIPLKLTSGIPVPGAMRIERAARLPPSERLHPGGAAAALLTFTSGSTGVPKGAVRTHDFLARQHDALASTIGAAPGDVDLVSLPIVVLSNLASGAATILPDADLRAPGAIDPRPVLRQIIALGATRLTASPAFLERVAERCLADQVALGGVRTVVTGGGPVFPDLLGRLARVAPTARLVAVYGSTEAEPIAHLGSDELRPADLAAMASGAGLLAGEPVRSLELRILRDAWGTPLPAMTRAELEARCVPPMQPGEIVVTGAHVLQGYLDGRGDEETKFRVDGAVWHRTGDLGYLDAQGRLWLLGRAAAKVSDDRGELYPFAVECAAREVFGVSRVAAVAHRGRRVLVVEPGAAGAVVDASAVRARLAWACLDDVVTTLRLPLDKRHNSKVDYPALVRFLDRTMRHLPIAPPAAPDR